MFDWLKQKEPAIGAVLFRGSLPPRLAEFSQFKSAGASVQEMQAQGGNAWEARINHPQWGEASIRAPKDFVPVPAEMVKFDPRLTEEDQRDATAAGSSVFVSMEPRDGNVLRDRKRLLKFLRLLLGDDGAITFDPHATKFWSRDALDDELVHDADLDVESLFVTHSVYEAVEGDSDEEEERNIYWAHTHGMSALGSVDFDLLRPSQSLVGRGYDFFRALAFMLLEGKVKPGDEVSLLGGVGPSMLVPVERFNKEGRKEDLALRGDPTDQVHNAKRVILCDPVAKKSFFSFGSKKVQASSVLSNVPEERMLCMFTNASTDLMSRRAKATAGVLRALFEEFKELDLGVLVKLGYRIDGGDATEREHMWFQVHGIDGSSVDATLINQPFNVSKLKEGDRGKHSLELLTDWQIMTPVGSINPRGMSTARIIRANYDKVKEFIAEFKRRRAGQPDFG